MTDTAAADTATASANGTAPGPAEAPCADCPTAGERLLAVLAALLGAFVIAVAIDMFTGGKLSGLMPERAPGE